MCLYIKFLVLPKGTHGGGKAQTLLLKQAPSPRVILDRFILPTARC